MTTLSRFRQYALVLLTLLFIQEISSGQSLYDVVASLSDRKRVISQGGQVQTYLQNQNNDPADNDTDLPLDDPIDWVGTGTAPTQSAVDGLDIGGKIALLNQAVVEFDHLKLAFLNSTPDEFNSGSTVGALKLHTSGDFDSLPRATPENYHGLLRELAQRVRALRLIQWPAAFITKGFTDQTNVWEDVDYNDPTDSNHDHNFEPYVKIFASGGITAPASVDWTPDSIGPGNLDVQVSDPYTTVTSYLDSQIQVHGWYSEYPADMNGVTVPLHWKDIGLSGSYPQEAKVSATAPGAAGTQIGGTVYVVRRSHWHQIDIDGASSKYEENEAGYVVEGSGNSGSVSLFSSQPSVTINGWWVTTDDYSNDLGDYIDKTFVEGGYQYKEDSILHYYNPAHSDKFTKSYEQNWKIGCVFHSVFKPTFTRGVDAASMRTKLESTDAILADKTADGELLLHPRPSLLFGIRLGPGLKGAGNGYVSCRSMVTERYGYYYRYDSWVQDGWNSMMRFDSSYSLRFAGSCSDYHVVYENDRSSRTQSLPGDSIGWPYTDADDVALHDTLTLYRAWDRPRLKQIAGRDLMADITYDTNHYGGYTVKIYRRSTGSAAPTPGQAMNLSGMTLIRTWTFSHVGGSTAHPTDAEKLEVAGSGGEKYEIQANEVLPDQGLGLACWNYEFNAWWLWMEGTHSWTLKLSQDTAEKLKKDIEITTTFDEDNSTPWDIALRESLDGQLVSTLSSMTLHPFNDSFPWDWTITSAGKTVSGSATPGDPQDRATRYGMLPTSVSIQYDGIQPNADYTWDSKGLLTSLVQAPWSVSGAMEGGAFKQANKFKGNTYATTWTEFTDGDSKVKTYSAPDGSASGKSSSSVAWSETEYGSASSGLPGLPYIVKNSDGSGATYGWNANGDGSYVLTLQEGLISGTSVSRGTRLVQSVNTRGFPIQSESFVVNGGTVKTGGTTFTNPTTWGMPRKATDSNTSLESSWTYDSDLSRLSSRTGALGVTSNFSAYDVLGRPGTVSSNGISSANTYTAFSTSSTISGSATGTQSENRDALGRLTSSNTTLNGVTDNLAVTPDASPVGITRTQTLLGTHHATIRKDDGSLAAASGFAMPFGGIAGTALSVDSSQLKTTTALGSQSAAFRTTWADAWGRVRKTETPSASGAGSDQTQVLYSDPDSSLKRVCTTDAAGRKTITESDPYNSSGAITRSGIDVNGNGTLGLPDRYVESVTTASSGSLVTVLKLTEDTGLREILRTTWTPTGNVTVTKINGNEETITRTPNYGSKTVSTTSTKGWSKTETFNNLGLTTASSLSGAGVPAASLNPAWRSDGSLASVSVNINGEVHSANFNNNGTLSSLNAPGRGNILGGHSISGGVETLTVDGVTTTQKLDGTQIGTSGSDSPSKTETLALNGSGFKQTTTPAVGAATNVSLNAAGAPTAKNYAAGIGEAYTHTNGGLLASISLARGGSLAFGYSNDGAKDLTSAAWPTVASGAFTVPAVAQGYGYDRAGRIKEIGDSSGVRGVTYQNGRLTETAWNSGALAGYKVVKSLDGVGRDTGFTLYRGNTVIHSTQKAPNGVSGEVSSLASGTLKVVLGRNGARQITGLQWGNAIGSFSPAVTQSWGRGAAGRITSATSSASGAPGFTYGTFDAKGRRQTCTTAGGAWTYGYTNGNLTSASHPTLGSFSYQFDGIGRRTENSANTGSLLNQTLGWTNRQNKTLKVTAHPSARVWVGIGTAAPTEIPSFTGANSYPITSPGVSGGWVPWNTLAVLTGQGDTGANADAKAEKSGAVWVPPISETFAYDAAGNRQNSALWDYGWNAKNELVRARTKGYNTPTTPQGYDITNAYDAEGRRFSKKVNRWQNGQIVEQKVITFLHDGNDLIYERHQLPSGLTTLERKYLWGPDITGGNAGGAGGLLLIREIRGKFTTDLYPLYDGTGHLIALTNSTGTLQAEYAYGPFGEIIYARGPKADSCPFRYATKYYDEETGLYNFGRRFLDPITGQWLSREPLGESESINLYSYCHNDPINNVDRLGLESVPMYQNQIAQAMAQLGWGQHEHEQTSRAIDADWAKWLELFAAAEAAGAKSDGRLMDAVAWVRATSHETNNALLANTAAGSSARVDIASAGINRIYRQSSFMEWVSGRDSGSLDPAGDPAYFDDDNPEFKGDEWGRRFIQFSPGGTIARHAVNGQYGAASYEFGKEVAIWSTLGIAGEFVGTGRVAFGVTRGGMGGGLNDLGVKSYLRFTQGSRWHSYYDSFLPGTARLRFSVSGRNGLWRGAASEGSAIFGQFASLQRPWSPFHCRIGNALHGVTDNAASRLWSVSTRPGFYVEGVIAPQGVFPGGFTQIFKANGNVLSRPLFGNKTPWSMLNETGY